MLAHSREYNDGQYYYAILPIENLGNLIVLHNELTETPLKKYFTEDDESALAIFESMIECQFNEGNSMLEKYKVGERLAFEMTSRIRVDLE